MRKFSSLFPFPFSLALLGLIVAGAGMQRRPVYQMPGRQTDPQPARRAAAMRQNARETAAPVPAETVLPPVRTITGNGTASRATSAPPDAPASEITAPPGSHFIPPLIRRADAMTFPPPRNDEPRNIPKTITICGDRTKPGPYTIRIKVPVGAPATPHIHPDTRMSVVISGSYYFGYGDVVSPETVTLLGPGGFFTEPAGVPHFGWAKDGEAVIQSSGFGKTATRVVPQAVD